MKILVINIKYLGDLIISTPALRALRNSYLNAEIIVMVRNGFEDVLKYNPYINGIITFNPQIKGKKSIKKLIEGIKFFFKIRKEKFDVVIALHPGDRIAFLSWLSQAKIRIAPRKQNFSFLLNKKVDVLEDSISYIDYYNKIIESFNVKVDSKTTEFFISEKEIKWAEEFFINNCLNDKEVLCIHPGASEPSKVWKKENFIKLINLLKQKSSLKILLISGPADILVCNAILSDTQDIIFYYSESILNTAALLKKSSLLLTHDTGTRHLAIALKVPVLALMPDDNSKCWDFYSEEERHYSLIGKRIKNDNESFLSNIQVEQVYDKIGEILNLW
ncbi:MAG: glycosyltransferase family 9 protein [Melioribacter sp.]|uniref:glycosyltransferase family 9 protein n=1 Tax=Rosettibacter primus TaxID=3111523 RepID=UPI00247CF8C1|nr:glycosyltransferase family 9 protein [Melioribacter sp.]